MLRIPEDVMSAAVRSPEAVLVPYVGVQTLLATPVLVTRPSLVLVTHGTKEIRPQDASVSLVAPAGHVLALRAGTHAMSEFHEADSRYSSWVLSLEAAFLREAVGEPGPSGPGPRVGVAEGNQRWPSLFADLAHTLAWRPVVDRRFALRELLMSVMRSEAVRGVLLREIGDWGTTPEERVEGVMAAHYLTPLKVPDFALLSGMSVSTFKRTFQSAYGIAPGRWLAQRRLDYAHTLLSRSRKSVSEVCDASGYRDVSTFIRAFRRAYDVTPSQVRRTR